MIRRFDECLADKVNKMTLVELERRINQNFLSQKMWESLQEQFDEMSTTIFKKLKEHDIVV